MLNYEAVFWREKVFNYISIAVILFAVLTKVDISNVTNLSPEVRMLEIRLRFQLMKILLILITLVFLCCPGCEQGEEIANESALRREAVALLVADYNAALNTADIDRMMTHYANDAVEIRPNEPALIGKEAIRSSKQQMFNEMNLREILEAKDVKVSGDLAVAHVTWSASVTPKTGGGTVNGNGDWIFVFKKDSDNAWKIIYSIWNEERLIYPDQPE